MASKMVCMLCNKTYRRSKGRHFGRFFCSDRCRWESRKVPISVVYKRDDATCHLCWQYVAPEDASRDHVKPRSEGGRMDFDNIKLAHRDCNSRRGSKPVSEFRDLLERQMDALRRGEVSMAASG